MKALQDRSGEWLRRAVDVHDGEVAVLLWSFAYFFCLLTGYYILRPLRDEMGIAGGVANLPWLFTATFAAMLVAILALGFVLWLGMAIGAVAVDMEISLGRLAEATLSAALLGMVFGALALAAGSATGKRGLSIGVTSAIGTAAYFLNALAPLVDALEPLTKLSPFYYYIGADPLTNGLNLLHAATLTGLALALLAVALVTFERRDLAV